MVRSKEGEYFYLGGMVERWKGKGVGTEEEDGE